MGISIGTTNMKNRQRNNPFIEQMETLEEMGYHGDKVMETSLAAARKLLDLVSIREQSCLELLQSHLEMINNDPSLDNEEKFNETYLLVHEFILLRLSLIKKANDDRDMEEGLLESATIKLEEMH